MTFNISSPQLIAAVTASIKNTSLNAEVMAAETLTGALFMIRDPELRYALIAKEIAKDCSDYENVIEGVDIKFDFTKERMHITDHFPYDADGFAELIADK